MAKKKRASEKQAFLAKKRKEQRQAASKAAKKKRRCKKMVITTICCAAAVGVIASGIVWTVKTRPLLHLISVEKTEHYSLNAAEISFYAWQIYDNYKNNSSVDASSLPDEDQPLSEQNYDDDTTWEEYFTDAAREYAQNILIFCEAADAEGYQPAQDLSSIAEASMDEFDTSTFPDGVTEEDAMHALELYLKAWNFNEEKQDSITFTDDELDAYYSENPKTMQVCSYMQFSFSFDDTDETAMQRSEAEELARELRRCDSKDAFENWVYSYYQENTSLTEAELESQVKTLYIEEATYTENDELSEWAFSEDAKAGDTTMLTDADNGKITVCLLISSPERDETYPVNLRQILFTASTYESTEGAHGEAERVLQEWESGDKTEESFAALADQYTEDTSVYGGLYTNVTKEQLMTDWRNWCFDTARQSGDVTILDSSYGSSLAYYKSMSEQPGWKLTATDALFEIRYQELQESYQKQADVQTTDWMMRFVKVNHQ